MSMDQASFFCPQCQQVRLFQSKPMNHVVHLLASVFLCGLWLPIWLLSAATHTPTWHCAFCGHYDQQKYLANPGLRDAEAQAERARHVEARQRREELAGATVGERLAVFVSEHKTTVIGVGLGGLVLGVIVFAITIESQQRAARNAEIPTPPKVSRVLRADVRLTPTGVSVTNTDDEVFSGLEVKLNLTDFGWHDGVTWAGNIAKKQTFVVPYDSFAFRDKKFDPKKTKIMTVYLKSGDRAKLFLCPSSTCVEAPEKSN
jgi:hypothetical protein